MFFNLTNHPLGLWSHAQIEAATGLGFGAPHDPQLMRPAPPVASLPDLEASCGESRALRRR